MTRLVILIFSLIVASGQTQTVQLGSATDPCAQDGTAHPTSPYLTQASGATIRFGDFTCNLTVPTDGLYQVRLDFQEPCLGECSPPVTAAGGRMENIYINQTPVLVNFDPFAAGANDPTVTVHRIVNAYAVNGKLAVKVETVYRNAVLSAISIMHGINVGGVPGGIYLNAIPAPADTVVDGVAYDGVVYLDQALKRLEVVPLVKLPVSQSADERFKISCAGGTICASSVTLSHPPDPPSSVSVWRNGTRAYTENNSWALGGQTITFTFQLTDGDYIQVTYEWKQ